MSDVSKYSIEYRVLSSVWWRESDQSRHAMKLIHDKLREKYGIEPPRGKIIKMWPEKLFQTGSVLDLPRSAGRSLSRENKVEVVKEEIEKDPVTSVRQVSTATSIPQTSTVHRIMKVDLELQCWKPVSVQFLTQSDHQSTVKSSVLPRNSSKIQSQPFLKFDIF